MKHLKKFNEDKETEEFIRNQRDDKKLGDSDITSGAVNCKFCSQCGKTNDGVTNPHEKFCADCGAYKVMADAFTPDHKEVKTFAFVPRK